MERFGAGADDQTGDKHIQRWGEVDEPAPMTAVSSPTPSTAQARHPRPLASPQVTTAVFRFDFASIFWKIRLWKNPGMRARWLAAAVLLAATVSPSWAPGAASRSPSSSRSPGTSSATPSLRPSAPVEFTIAATGDLLIHMPIARQAQVYAGGHGYDFRPMLAPVKPLLAAADLAICHLETPLSPDDTNISGYPVFNTPHELADAIKEAGYKGCSTASNHAIDAGADGVTATLDALDEAGIAHAGTARTREEAEAIEVHTVKGVRIAHLSYTYGTNGIPAPASQPWLVNVTDVARILADAARAKQAGAQFVVVSMHWGVEYQTAPTPEQQAQAQTLLASPDVDLILGDHVHVLQPVQKIGDKYVIYGLGNLLSNQSPAAGLTPNTEDGAILTAQVRAQNGTASVERVTYTATYVEIGPYTVWPTGSGPARLRSQLDASYQRTAAAETSLPGHERDAQPDPR